MPPHKVNPLGAGAGVNVLAHFRTSIALPPDGRLWVADQADQRSAGAGEVVADAEAIQDAVHAVGEPRILRVLQVWQRPRDLAPPPQNTRAAATFDPTEVRTVIHIAACERIPG
jgi:hypothetical protein